MKNSRGGPLPIVIIMNIILAMLIALVILFVVAFIKELNTDSTLSNETSSLTSSEESSEDSSFDNIDDTSSFVEETSSTVSQPTYTSGVVVAESDRVLNSYFDDVVFIGDSLTEGIKLYDIMSNATVLSHTGLGLDNIYTKEVVEQPDGTKISVIDALKLEENVNKIYILMGPNSIGYNKETFISKYGLIVDSVKQIHPDAIIYVQSMLPVTTTNNYKLDNAVIDEYNLALIDMAEEKEVFYLDVNSALKGPDGALPTEASPADGMHFNATYYQKWFDYLKTHTVK